MSLSRLSGLDARGLAAFRALVGLHVAWDAWWSLFSHAHAFLSDEGFVPRSLVPDRPPFFLSLFFWFEGTFFTRVLLLMTVFCAISFAFGWRTRFFGWMTWILLTSVQWRNPLIGHSGDVLLRSLLFFANWMPLGRVYSFDSGVALFHRLQMQNGPESSASKKQRGPGGASSPAFLVTGLAHVAFLIQLACFLFFGAMSKLGNSVWTSECSAVSLLLESPYATWFGRMWSFLLPRWAGCLIARFGVYWDMCLAVALLVPVSFVRLVVALALGTAALMEGSCLRVETLFWGPLYASFVLLPSHVWSGLQRVLIGKCSLVLHVRLDDWLSSRVLFFFHTYLLGEGVVIKWEESSETDLHWLSVSNRGHQKNDADALQLLLESSFFPGTRILAWIVGCLQGVVNQFGALLGVFQQSDSFLRARAQLPMPIGSDSDEWSLWKNVRRYSKTGIIILCVLALLSFNLSQTKVFSSEPGWIMSKVGNWSSLHDQRWDTFANMTNASFWYKIRGLSWAGQDLSMFEDGLLGTKVHLWDGFSEPRSHSAQRGSLMMKRYLEQVIDHGSEDLRNAFGGAFCKRWKAKNEASDAPVKFTVFRVWYSKDGEDKERMRKHAELFNYICMKKVAKTIKSTPPQVVDWPQKKPGVDQNKKQDFPRWQLPKSATNQAWPDVRMRSTGSGLPKYSLPSNNAYVAEGVKMTYRFNFNLPLFTLEPVKLGAPEVIDRSPPWLHILKKGEESLRLMDGQSSVLLSLFRKWAKVDPSKTAPVKAAPVKPAELPLKETPTTAKTTKNMVATTAATTTASKEEEEDDEEEEEANSTKKPEVKKSK